MFSKADDFQKSKKMRSIAMKAEIPIEYFIHIIDLGLRDYDEVVSLYPELKKFSEEKVRELVNEVRIN